MARTMAYGFGTCLLLACICGCNGVIAGQWRSVEPVELPPEIARIRQVTFQPDGWFEARIQQQHRITNIEGTYRFAPGHLVLSPTGATQTTLYDYGAEQAGDLLILTQGNRTYRLCRDRVRTPAATGQAASTQQAVRVPATLPAASSERVE